MDVGSSRVGPPVDDLVETEIDGHISLYHPATARAHVLNGPATDTWLLSDGEHTGDQIVELLARAYGTEPDEIRSAVLDTVELFAREGLLRPEDGPA